MERENKRAREEERQPRVDGERMHSGCQRESERGCLSVREEEGCDSRFPCVSANDCITLSLPLSGTQERETVPALLVDARSLETNRRRRRRGQREERGPCNRGVAREEGGMHAQEEEGWC